MGGNWSIELNWVESIKGRRRRRKKLFSKSIFGSLACVCLVRRSFTITYSWEYIEKRKDLFLSIFLGSQFTRTHVLLRGWERAGQSEEERWCSSSQRQGKKRADINWTQKWKNTSDRHTERGGLTAHTQKRATKMCKYRPDTNLPEFLIAFRLKGRRGERNFFTRKRIDSQTTKSPNPFLKGWGSIWASLQDKKKNEEKKKSEQLPFFNRLTQKCQSQEEKEEKRSGLFM